MMDAAKHVVGPGHVETTLGDLADPLRMHEPVDLRQYSTARLLEMLRTMKLIRRTEEAVGDLVNSGEARCPCHLAVGQEACAVGVAAQLDPARDRAFGAHRSHGHYLAMGGDLTELIAEILGKATGCARGMGGSMHLVAPERGLLGTVPIVGATIPMAVGAAMALQFDGLGGIAVVFFGDGATEEGVFHESMNLAAIRRLPVLFACENNFFSSHLHISLRQPSDSIARYAAVHGVAFEILDGNDVVAVAQAADRALARARAGQGPTLLEMVTYRWRGHVGPREDLDVGVKRSGELPLWKRRDPIARLVDGLMRAGHLATSQLSEMDAAIDELVHQAVAAARTAPYPDAGSTSRYVYAEIPE